MLRSSPEAVGAGTTVVLFAVLLIVDNTSLVTPDPAAENMETVYL